jgi:hypothetical protein
MLAWLDPKDFLVKTFRGTAMRWMFCVIVYWYCVDRSPNAKKDGVCVVDIR